MFKRNERKILWVLAIGAAFLSLYACISKYNARDKYLAGTLVLDGANDITEFSFWKHGEKIVLDKDSIHAVFDSFENSTEMFVDMGTNGFGNGFPAELRLNNGAKYGDLISYESNRHILTFDFGSGLFQDSVGLSTKLTDPKKIKLIETLFSN